MLAAFWFRVVVVGDDVVDLAAPGRSGAVREHAGLVPQNDLLAELVGDPVAGRLEDLVEVDDRLDGDLGVGRGTILVLG